MLPSINGVAAKLRAEFPHLNRAKRQRLAREFALRGPDRAGEPILYKGEQIYPAGPDLPIEWRGDAGPLVLSARDAEAFMDALENPKPPTPYLIETMRRYGTKQGRGEQ